MLRYSLPLLVVATLATNQAHAVTCEKNPVTGKIEGREIASIEKPLPNIDGAGRVVGWLSRGELVTTPTATAQCLLQIPVESTASQTKSELGTKQRVIGPDGIKNTTPVVAKPGNTADQDRALQKAVEPNNAPPVATKVVTDPANAGGPAIKVWDIRAQDLSIFAAVKRWALEAGWQLSWEIPVDYPTTILGGYRGTFEEAINHVMTAYANSDYPPKACLYENRVVQVVRRVGDGRECPR